MQHASLAYPSHLVPIFEVGLFVVGLLAALAWPSTGRAVAGALLRWLERAAEPAWRAVLLVGLLAGLGNAATTWLQGAPIPWVSDEYSYLLAADTFASGRLANPAVAHPALAGIGVLGEPVYASKYSPAQGLLLAAGQRLFGQPVAGLWLCAALLAAAVTWALQAWVGAPWAVLGGLLVILRLAVGGYWNQSYWGGSVAAIGGALLYGALRRLVDGPARVRHSLLLGLGLALLATSRPFEGLLVALPAALVLGRWILRLEAAQRSRAWRRVIVPTALVLALAAGAAAVYNQLLTGSPWRLPHSHYRQLTGEPGEFVWQRPPGAASQHALPAAAEGGSAWSLAWALGAYRLGLSLFFLLGPALAVPLLLGWRRWRDGWALTAGGACLLVWLGHGVSSAYFPHYSAPLVAPLWALALGALESGWEARWRRRPLGPSLTVVAVIVLLVSFLVQLPAQRLDANDPRRRQVDIRRYLEERPGADLVLLPASMPFNLNGADLASAPVLWAADLGEQANRRLFALYPDRHLWRIDAQFRLLAVDR